MIEEFGGRWHDVLPSAENARTFMTAPPVIALHCSGADGRQWRKLADALAPRFKLLAMDCYGCESTGARPGERAFTLADEAQRVVDLIDKLGTAVHLVGHSYGGGVMLRVAFERPAAVASLTLYEPSAFHLLSQLGPSGLAAQEEILRLTRAVSWGIVSGDYHTAICVSSTIGTERGARQRCGPMSVRTYFAGSQKRRSTFKPCCVSERRWRPIGNWSCLP